jgi:hypothetical protein
METLPSLRAILLVLATAAVVLGSAAPAAAQAELLRWVDPTLGKIMGRGDYRVTFYSEERVEGQNARLDLIQHNFTLVTPLYQDSTDEWAVSGRLRYQNYDTRARLPDSGQRQDSATATSSKISGPSAAVSP